MKVRYISENGCVCDIDEVINVPQEYIDNFSEEDLNNFLKKFKSYYGCTECVEFIIVNENTKHNAILKYDNIFKDYMICY